jgi:opacity protein-like surface antigen
MKPFLMAMVYALVFIAISAQAANDKIYFAGNVGLSHTDDLDSPDLNISFRPVYNVDDSLGNEMGRFRAGSVEVGEANGITSPIDTDLSALTFMPNGYYDIEIVSSPITPFIGSGLGLVRSEIDTGVSGSVDKEELGYQFMSGLGFNVSPTTVLTGEYRFLGVVGSDVHNTHAFVFGARFSF